MLPEQHPISHPAPNGALNSHEPPECPGWAETQDVRRALETLEPVSGLLGAWMTPAALVSRRHEQATASAGNNHI